MEANFFGLAQPKHRTLDVEVNLLSEWLERRTRVREATTRLAIGLSACLLLGIAFVPSLWRWSSAATTRAEGLRRNVASALSEFESLDRQRQQTIPKVDEAAMAESVRKRARLFLGHGTLVLNAGQPGMAVDTLGVEVIGGELTIRCKADAENSRVSALFIAGAGKGPNTRSVLLSNSQKNGKLGDDGIEFEMVKRVEVDR